MCYVDNRYRSWVVTLQKLKMFSETNSDYRNQTGLFKNNNTNNTNYFF